MSHLPQTLTDKTTVYSAFYNVLRAYNFINAIDDAFYISCLYNLHIVNQFNSVYVDTVIQVTRTSLLSVVLKHTIIHLVIILNLVHCYYFQK